MTLSVSPHKFPTFSTTGNFNTLEIPAFTSTVRVTISVFSIFTFNASVNTPSYIRNHQKHIYLLFLLFLSPEVVICLNLQHFTITGSINILVLRAKETYIPTFTITLQNGQHYWFSNIFWKNQQFLTCNFHYHRKRQNLPISTIIGKIDNVIRFAVYNAFFCLLVPWPGCFLNWKIMNQGY